LFDGVVWTVTPTQGACFPHVGYGDGSGLLPKLEYARRCGWSVASFSYVGRDFLVTAAAHGPLPGLVQEVPAAELYAFTFYLKHAVSFDDGTYTYNTDCQWVIDVWGAGEQASTYGLSVHVGLWKAAFRAGRDVGIQSVRLLKVRAHRSVKSCVSRQDGIERHANNFVDVEAKRGATLHPTNRNVSLRVARSAAAVPMVGKYLSRLAVWAREHGFLSSNVASQSASAPQCRYTGHIQNQHISAFDVKSLRWRCRVCHLSAVEEPFLARLPCEPLAAGVAHAMWEVGGILFCMRCGS